MIFVFKCIIQENSCLKYVNLSYNEFFDNVVIVFG